eukprot:CAMPEP_0180699112 /NCGR_PEP_ID=MMETSP1038_2-20121128/4382_1 /TAXON_ID=632150 /ORGANISM="Azadinium spinosum, Strain 3D9" /LENGTH=172 /DNA_ID=CAMNT_0022730723 /DNA_START=406 /DNA_END=924 /DNA_ORIENTATION=+
MLWDTQLHGTPEVDQLREALAVDHHVFGLEVTEGNGAIMQVLQGQQETAGVELRLRPGKNPYLPDDAEELPASHDLREEIHIPLVLESAHHLHDEWMVVLEQNLPFETQVLMLPMPDSLLPTDALQGVLCVAQLVLDEFDHTESSGAYDAHHLEVVEREDRLLQLDPLLQML